MSRTTLRVHSVRPSASAVEQLDNPAPMPLSDESDTANIDEMNHISRQLPKPPIVVGKPPPPPLLGDDQYHQAIRALILQLLEKKATHSETQSSVTGTLVIIHAALGPFLPEPLRYRLPRTWHKAMNFVKQDLPPHEVIHGCSNECGTFFVDGLSHSSQCPNELCCGQRFIAEKKPAMPVHYMPLIPRLRQRFACVPYSTLLRYPHNRTPSVPGAVSDIMDGTRWRHSFVEHFGESEYNIALMISSDSFPLDKKRKRSVTPILAQIINLPPYLRAKTGAQLMLMQIPTKATKVGVYLTLLLRELRELQSSTGIRMWHGADNAWVQVRATILFDNNDIVAAPKISGTKAAGSIIGGCHICNVRGMHVRALGTRVYLGAHRFLPIDDRLR